MKYPSGAEMPQYGPSTNDEFITDGLEWAHAMLLARDEMNAAVHCGPVRLSPVTLKVQIALGLWRERLTAGAVPTTTEQPTEEPGFDRRCPFCCAAGAPCIDHRRPAGAVPVPDQPEEQR